MSTEDAYPPGVVMFLGKVIDVTTGVTTWRKFLPFGMADSPGGWFSENYIVGDGVSTLAPLVTFDEYVRSAPEESSLSLRTLCDFAFQTPSTVLGDLTSYPSMGVLLVLVLLLRLVKSRLLPIFSGIGRRAGRATHGVEWEKKNEERIMKFGEYVFRLIFHSLISAYGVWYFRNKPWWDLWNEDAGTKLLFIDHDSTIIREARHPIEPGMAWYYLIQSAYNLEAMISLMTLSLVMTFQSPLRTTSSGKNGKVLRTMQLQSPLVVGWSPTVRGDFREMFVHHLITNLLIGGSSYFRFTRIGSMVFLVHDISDVPVDMSKLANFLKWKKTTIVCFVTMVLVWLATRLIVLPFVIYRSALTESYLMVSANGMDPIYWYCYRPVFYTLFALIILLHLVWFFMFIRMGLLLITRGEAHDLSEHKKGEKQLPEQAFKGKKTN
eukprot:CAMPEP_0197437490 /NCGR_PEP_ID=MMETSP1175-20131217/4716_1 /TAXON_ID=1003142 /ORGANISM="Triceratium dubium, Strain CCMP147" /LENGTH=435 /DNA_ID=CAMNT_0042967025 /DNA_START=206 /DNA_END=1513 /DNA_ORIENTATION=+